MNVRRLDGTLLNHWIAQALGLRLQATPPAAGMPHDPGSGCWHPANFDPASNWAQAGPSIADDWYAIEDKLQEWFGDDWPQVPTIKTQPLTWFLRALVANQYGDEVEELALMTARSE